MYDRPASPSKSWHIRHFARTRTAATLLALLAFPAALVAGPAQAADSARAQPVERGTPQGTLLGIRRDEGVEVYRAIPYALPPVGIRRWQPPEPAPAWAGVRDARAFSPQCVQQPYPPASVFARPDRPQSEDCLYLNVWTAEHGATGASGAADESGAPVMVWIHGGGLTRGTGATPSYDGGALARRGVVLVTINYRLGPFGYLAHPELSAESPQGVSGNYGYLDQIAALRWVQDNIAAFGGDPDRVTIFGESAGSRSVNALMVTPASKGLFHGAIGQSGAGFAPTQALKTSVHGLKPAEAWGKELGATLEAPTLEAMRAAPAHRVLEAAEALGMPSTTVVDGHVIPAQPGELFAAGRQHAVPVIVGFNKDEGTSLTPPAIRASSAVELERMAERRFDDLADRFLELYPTSTPELSWLAAFRDQRFGWEMVSWANATATVDQPAWMYYFTHHPSGPYQDALRAYHAGEIRYVFDNMHLSPDATDVDRRVADLMSSYWASFAEDFDPNGPGLPEWEAWNRGAMNYLEFGAEAVPGEGLIREAAAFYDDLDPERMVRGR